MTPDVALIPFATRLLSGADPYALAISAPYALALGAVAAEVAWLSRGQGRRRVLPATATATGMAAGALVVGLVYTPLLRFLWAAVATQRLEPAADLWRAHPVLGAAVAFVAWDLSGWVYHVVGHRTRVGWAAHQAHHSGQEFDLTLGLRQTWFPFHGLVHQPLLALAGFDLRVIFVCAAMSNCWQLLEHISLPLRFPRWLEAAVMTPAAHRHHQARDARPVNLGPVLTVWDRLAGTWVAPDAPAPTAYGPAAPAPANPVTLELAGWRHLTRRHGQPSLAR
ncbi:MAG: sterol desaturase family protein [Acidimicrobiales bacterium]